MAAVDDDEDDEDVDVDDDVRRALDDEGRLASDAEDDDEPDFRLFEEWW